MGMDEVKALLEKLQRGIRLMIGRAVIASIDDGGGLQRLQLKALADEVMDLRERFQEYGFSSRPHPGAEAVLVSLGGNRTNTVVIAVDDRRYRLKSLGKGDVALYSSGENYLILRANGDIEAHAPGNLTASVAGDASVVAGGEARVEGDIARLHGNSKTIVGCAGHGEVWYPDHKDSYTTGAIAGTTYPIASPEIPS